MPDASSIVACLEEAAARLSGASIVAGARAKQRGHADVIESYASEMIRKELSGRGFSAEPAQTKRSLEDFSVKDGDRTVWVDIKSKDLDGKFSMPNLISIQRLWKLFEAKDEDLVFVFMDYRIQDALTGTAKVNAVRCAPVARLNPDCLHIQNLGLGQLQLRPGTLDQDLLLPDGEERLRSALPGMAADFHRRQAIKAEREREIWAGRMLALS
jgi:hypothetical protein